MNIGRTRGTCPPQKFEKVYRVSTQENFKIHGNIQVRGTRDTPKPPIWECPSQQISSSAKWPSRIEEWVPPPHCCELRLKAPLRKLWSTTNFTHNFCSLKKKNLLKSSVWNELQTRNNHFVAAYLFPNNLVIFVLNFLNGLVKNKMYGKMDTYTN